MISAQQREFLLSHAYVPEHSPDLMESLSGSEVFFEQGYLFLNGTNKNIVLVGYPIDKPFHAQDLELFIAHLKNRFKPMKIYFVAPHPLSGISCISSVADQYYTWVPTKNKPTASALRRARRGAQMLSIEKGNVYTTSHKDLSDEFIKRADPGQDIELMLDRIRVFLQNCSNAQLLSAWTPNSRLSAFMVVDTSPKKFCTYVIGCHSKSEYIAGASDLLFAKMIEIALETGKEYIHLGLGVSDGIRRFKVKWGGTPSRDYHSCIYEVKKRSFFDSLFPR